MRAIVAGRRSNLGMGLILSMLLCMTGVQQIAEANERPKITLAVNPTPYAAVLAVAEEKRFFKEEGIEINMKSHPSGLDALKAMMRGDAQIATVADVAFALNMQEHPSLRIIASIGMSVGSQIVARKDRNIREPADLKGKKIGYSPGTASDYFFHAFLLTNHLSRNDVTAVAIPSSRQAEAVVVGEIDAVSAFDIYAFDAKKGLGENAVSWDSQNKLGYQWLLAARESFTRSPEAIKRLLKTLIKAEEFILSHERETKSIIARKWNFSPEYVDQSWSRSRIGVSLNQSIITGLRSYAKWEMERRGKTGDPPDVLSCLFTGALEQIEPKLVTIFR